MESKYFTIRGYQKSGTNWLSNLVNRHPSIFCRGEYHFGILKKSVNSYLSNDFRARFKKEILTNYRRSVKSCLKKGVDKENVLWYGDRTPTDLKPLILPDIKQLFIVRDGRDVFVSQIYHRLRHGFNDAHINNPEFKRLYDRFPMLGEKLELFKEDTSYFENNPEELITDENYVKYFAQHWDNYIQSNLKFIANLKSKNKRDSVYLVKYEDLHNDVDTEMSKIMDFFGLESVGLAELDEKTSPGFKKVDNLSLYRSGKVRDWEKYFSEGMLQCYNTTAEKSLLNFNYNKINRMERENG